MCHVYAFAPSAAHWLTRTPDTIRRNVPFDTAHTFVKATQDLSYSVVYFICRIIHLRRAVILIDSEVNELIAVSTPKAVLVPMPVALGTV